MDTRFELHTPTLTTKATVTREQVNALKTQVQQFWLHGKEQRIATGELLNRLRQALSKKGHGTFNEALTELGIPRSTAHDYIQAYRVANGYKPAKTKTVRMSETRTFRDLHSLRDAIGEYFRNRPEDVEAFLKWVSANVKVKEAPTSK